MITDVSLTFGIVVSVITKVYVMHHNIPPPPCITQLMYVFPHIWCSLAEYTIHKQHGPGFECYLLTCCTYGVSSAFDKTFTNCWWTLVDFQGHMLHRTIIKHRYGHWWHGADLHRGIWGHNDVYYFPYINGTCMTRVNVWYGICCSWWYSCVHC